MNKIIVFFLLLVSLSSYAQQKEWNTVVKQLKKEAEYFKGKKGYIRLTAQKYNTFSIEHYTITDTLFRAELKLFDRYENVDGVVIEKQEIKFDFTVEQPIFSSVVIAYGSDFYFEDYPDYVFLKLTFSDAYTAIDKNNVKQITIPIRRRQLEEILKAIDSYQQKTLTMELNSDRSH